MPNGVAATMSVVGYLYEPQATVDRLVAWWFANRIDQSTILGNIPSYQYVVASHQNDFRIDEFLEDVKTNLRTYLLECFEGADVQASAPGYEVGSKMFSLHVAAVVERDGKRYDVAQSVLLNGESYKLVDNGRHQNVG